MKVSTPKKPKAVSPLKSKRISLKQLLLDAYVRHGRDPLTRLAVRQCMG
ncbi:MAG: hypothetical protein V4710_10615 [Verrucomicrobiota bacterium]